jgi:hypothetical protein
MVQPPPWKCTMTVPVGASGTSHLPGTPPTWTASTRTSSGGGRSHNVVAVPEPLESLLRSVRAHRDRPRERLRGQPAHLLAIHYSLQVLWEYCARRGGTCGAPPGKWAGAPEQLVLGCACIDRQSYPGDEPSFV